MSSIGSSSYYSVSGNKSSGSNGIAGLMSGMDTEAMVEKMLSGTQSKIDKQNALKLQTQWKQEIYRDMISSINNFRNKYFNTKFDASSKNNFASNSFFNSMLSTIKQGSAVRLLGTSSSALTGEFRVAVKELATSAKLTSSEVSGAPEINGKALNAEDLGKAFEKKLSFSVVTKTDNPLAPNVKNLEVALEGVKTEDEMASRIQDALDHAGVTDVTAKVFDGKLRFVSTNDDVSISVDGKKSSALGLQMTGFSKVEISNLEASGGTGKKYQASNKINLDASISMDFTLDGVKKTINLKDVAGTWDVDGKFTVDPSAVKDTLETELQKQFGDSIRVSLSADNKLKLDIAHLGKGHELTVTGANATAIGIEPGSASHITTFSKLNQLSGVSGDRFSFKINDTEFTFSGDTSITSMMNTINNSSAGVRMTYSALSDTFKMESTSTGDNYGVKIEQTEGNIMSKLFTGQVDEGTTAGSKTLTTGKVVGTELDADYKTEGASFKMKVNGQTYSFEMPAKKDSDGNPVEYGKAQIETTLNSWLADTFKDKDGVAQIKYRDGNLEVAKGYQVEFEAAKVDPDNANAVKKAKQTDLAYAMGLNVKANSNIANASTKLEDIQQLEGMDFAGTVLDKNGAAGSGATTLGDLASISGMNVRVDDGRLVMSGADGTHDLTGNAQLAGIFGDSITLGRGDKVDLRGTDAKVLLNGVETTRSSNNFTIDGISMELTQVSAQKADGTYEETIIGTERDNEQIVESFKTFVEDYNKMIDTLNKYVSEPSDYRKYPPLTAAQKKEMSEKEIELWEENAKKGLLRNDDYASGLLSQMRGILYTKPDSAPFALYQIGIETTKDYNDGGKIQLDETALRAALSQDPDGVRNLFTDTEKGISTQLTKAMDAAASTSFASPGSMVAMAGVKGGTTEKVNTIYDQIQRIDTRIKELQYKYEKERQRYWNQFNSMEQIMANFNSQSAMISQQFSGY